MKAATSDKPNLKAREVEFQNLVHQWRQEVGGQSSLSRIVANRHYLRIIALGEPVISLILKELQREPAPWFVALQALTGEYHVGSEFAGNFRKMADAWITWGRQHGYV